MRAIKPRVVLLSRNTSCKTAPKIRRFLPKYWKYLNETITFTDNALHIDKNIGIGSSPLRGRVDRTRELYHEFRSDVRSICPERENRGILASIINKNIYNRSLDHGNIPVKLYRHIIYHVYSVESEKHISHLIGVLLPSMHNDLIRACVTGHIAPN